MSVLMSPCHAHASPKDLVGLKEQWMPSTNYSVVVSAVRGSDQKNLSVWEASRATGDRG